MRAVVFAYSQVGYRCLETLLQAGDEVTSVYTHPDDPAETRWFDSVADLAASRSIQLFTPEDANEPGWIDRIRDDRPEALFSFYYRKLLCREILDIPSTGAFNMHGSLLPLYRGRCPVNWALIHGETVTGVTLHEMIEKPDAGDIVGQHRIEIAAEDDALSLSRKIGEQAALLLGELLPALRRGDYPRTAQRLAEGSYCGGRTPEDGRIDWTRSAEEIHNLVRAVTRPWPGAFTAVGGRRLYIWKAKVDRGGGDAAPGTLQAGSPPAVYCGRHRLILQRWQFDGEKDQNSNENGDASPAAPGTVLG